MTLARDWLMMSIFALSAAVTIWTESEVVSLFFLSGVAALLIRTPLPLRPTAASFLPLWLVSGLHGPAGLALFPK